MATETLSPMQAELLKRADAIFDSIAKAAQTVGSFAQEQVPDIAYQYVAFGRAMATTVMIIALLFMITSAVTFVIAYKTSGDYKLDGTNFLACMASFVTGIIGITVVAFTLRNTMLVWFAPKVWLIEEIIHLVKSTH